MRSYRSSQEKLNLRVKSLISMSDHRILSPSKQSLFSMSKVLHCGRCLNLDDMDRRVVIILDLDCPWLIHAWGDPSCEGVCLQLLLVDSDDLDGVKSSLSPKMKLKAGQDMCLDPQDLQWCRNLSKKAQCCSRIHWELKGGRNRAEHRTFLWMQMPVLARA